jgi:hypothetical protein
MKINEILTENTVDESVVDSVKNLGQNFASGLKGGAKTGVRNAQGKFTKAGLIATAVNKLGKGVAAIPKLPQAVAAAKTGYQASQTSKQQAEQTKKVATGALQKWVAIDKNIKLSGQQAQPAQAVQWFTTFTGSAPTTTPANTSLNTMSQWVNTEVSNFMAKRALGPAATPAPTPTVAKSQTTKSTKTTAPLPTIGGIGPNDPRYAALAAKTKNAPATPVR